MFFRKLKNESLQGISISLLATALVCMLPGCRGSIDDSALESNKITERTFLTESSGGESSDESGKHMTGTHGGDVSTTSKDKETSDKETTRRETPTTPVATEPVTTPPAVPQTTTTPPATQPPPTAPPVTPPQTTAPISYVIKVNNPVAAGTAVKSENGYSIDYSNASQGYIMAKGSSSFSGKICVQVCKDNTNNILAQYVDNNSASYVPLSLTGGNGHYIVRILEAKADGKYSIKCTVEMNVSLVSETAPYIYPNYNVSFNQSSAAVAKAYELCAGLSSDREKAEAVKRYVIAALSYDNDLAAQIGSKLVTSYTPNADSTLAKGKGICYDYSCLFAVMLRCQSIPTKMVHGYTAEGAYHAWNEVYYDGAWHLYDTTYEDGGALSSSYTPTKYY